MDAFSKNLMSLRKMHGLSQKQLAMLTGIPLPVLRMMERGQLTPEADNPRLAALCQVFGVAAGELLDTD